MVKAHIIKDDKTEKCFCGIEVDTTIKVSGHLSGECLTEGYIKLLDIERIICKRCLRFWRGVSSL